MSARKKFIGSAVLAAVALAVWRILAPSGEMPLVEAPEPAPETVADAPALVEPLGPVPGPAVQARAVPAHTNSAEVQPAAPDPNALNEHTLVGTKWERGGFGLEFGAEGRLLIGGRERARWRIEGSRIRLHRDTTGEEHWLDIVGGRLMWEGQEIGRAP